MAEAAFPEGCKSFDAGMHWGCICLIVYSASERDSVSDAVVRGVNNANSSLHDTDALDRMSCISRGGSCTCAKHCQASAVRNKPARELNMHR
jgi:hypothetical protein